MLTEKEKKLLNRYEEDLAMPKWKYVLLYGLSFGLLLVIINVITDLLFDNVTLSEIFRRRFWISLATAPLGGILFGLIMRWLSLKQYRKLKDKESIS
jgi:hypothetical protein